MVRQACVSINRALAEAGAHIISMNEKINTKSGFDWWQNNVTNEIYLNTHREDWWRACDIVAGFIKDAKSFIDVGGGDGHTLWQILSVAQEKGANIQEVTFVEPSKSGLQQAERRLGQFQFKKVELHEGTLETEGERLLAARKQPYDVLYAGHVNYYFGKEAHGRVDRTRYEKMLEMLPKLGKKVILMTAPKDSDYYKLVEKNPFSDLAYSGYVVDFFKNKGYLVDLIDTPIRFYVAHALKSKHEAVVLWRFFNDTQEMPSHAQIEDFRAKVHIAMDKTGHVNIKDQLVVVSGKD